MIWFRNISCLFLSLVVLCAAGCRKRARICGLEPAVGPVVAHEIQTEQGTGMVSVALKEVEASMLDSRSVAVKQQQPAGPVVVSTAATEQQQTKITRIYPCPQCATVQLDKTMPGQTEINKPFTYNIKLTNLTDLSLAGVTVTEELPADFELTGADPAATQQGSTLVWEIDSLAPRGTVNIAVSGVPSKTELLKYCTNVVVPLTAVCTHVEVIQPRLKLAKYAPEGVLLCDPIEVKFVLSNTGTGPARDVKIVDTLPDGLETADGKSELVIDAGTLNAGQVKEFAATLKAVRPATYVNKALATSANGHQAESEPTTTVVDEPVLTIAQSGPEKLYVGRAATYEITVTNQSDAPAQDVVIVNQIPLGVTSMKATAGARLTDGYVTWPLGTLAPNASRTVHISFSPTRAGTITNKVTAKAHCAEPVTATAQTTISAIPAVLLEVVDITDPVEIGGRTTYVITVTNQGSAESTNVSIVCQLEENMRYVSSSGSTVATVEDGSIVFAPLAKLAPKAKATWRVVVTALKAGDTRFKATMNSDELERSVEETEATRVYE